MAANAAHPSAAQKPDATPFESLLTITEVGKAGTDGGIRFRVLSLGEVPRIPPLVNDRGSRLVRARVSYTNRTELPLDLLCRGEGFQLLDSEDHKVRPLDGTRNLAGKGLRAAGPAGRDGLRRPRLADPGHREGARPGGLQQRRQGRPRRRADPPAVRQREALSHPDGSVPAGTRPG